MAGSSSCAKCQTAAAQSFGNPQLLSEQSQDFEVRGQTRILRCEVVEGGREQIQDSRSMKPGFRNASLLITHVLDMCVKSLVVLNISSAQGQSVDLSVTITTGQSRMLDIIRTPGRLAAAQYGA